MNEEKVIPETKNKKKHSLWWIWFVLILCAFAGGTIFGLKLPEMDLPEPIANLIFADQPAAVEETPAPTETQAAEASAKPTASLPAAKKPAETVKPIESPDASAAPTESPAAAAENGPEEIAIPSESLTAVISGETAAHIGIDAALKAALSHAKVNEKDADVSGVYPETIGSMTVYAVDFTADAKAYSYTVDAFSGEILGWKTARAELSAASDAAGQQAAPAVSNLPDMIDEAQAKQTAFSHAGVKESGAGKISVKLELENQSLVYEVKFTSGIYEYEYLIDAVSGAIISSEKELA